MAGDSFAGSKRWWVASVLPPAALFAWVVFPLARGSDTLYLRDVFATHLPLKQAQAAALREGRLPTIDPFRGLGQPLSGNPNAVPFYPDNLLYLFTPTLFALNAHFWLHWLLAAPAMYALGRAWGLTPPGAWAAGVLWATGGYFLSQLNFYNLVAGVALAPAFVAACLAATREGAAGPRAGDAIVAQQVRSPTLKWAAAAGALWALLLLAGDPMTALAALAAAAGAVLVRRLSLPRAGGFRALLTAPAAALACGTLVAAPQLVEFARALDGSFRGLYGYSLRAATAASWDPRLAIEGLLPFPLGRLDLLRLGSFWGHAVHGGHPPFFLSLYPGLLALALLAAAGRRREALSRWGWAAAGVGLFFALGRHNPLVAWVFPLTGLRYPVKLWLLVAMGLAIVGGAGFERAIVGGEARARRRVSLALAGLALALVAGWGTLTLAEEPASRWLRSLVPETRPGSFVEAERLRLGWLCFASAGIAGAFALAVWAAGRWPKTSGAGLLALHALSQLVLLSPLLPTDAALPYRVPPPLLARLPPDAVVAHGAFSGLFGRGTLEAGRFPEPRAHWLTRRAFFELYPSTGPILGRRYAFNPSPEGLDGFWSRMALAAAQGSPDRDRLRLLAASGVDLLLLDRPLDPEAAKGARLLLEMPSFGHRLRVYEVERRLGEAQLAGRVFRAADLDQAFRRLTDSGFDPRRQAVAAGSGVDLDGPPGEARTMAAGAERWAGEVESAAGGLLVLRRAYLPLYRAFLDGRETRTVVANLHLLGLEVPPGRHRVEVRIDRRPFLASLPLAGLGALGLGVLGVRSRHRGPSLRRR